MNRRFISLFAAVLLVASSGSLFLFVQHSKQASIRTEMRAAMFKLKLELEDGDFSSALVTKRSVQALYNTHHPYFEKKCPIGFFVLSLNDSMNDLDLKTAAFSASWAIDQLDGAPTFPSEPHYK